MNNFLYPDMPNFINTKLFISKIKEFKSDSISINVNEKQIFYKISQNMKDKSFDSIFKPYQTINSNFIHIQIFKFNYF